MFPVHLSRYNEYRDPFVEELARRKLETRANDRRIETDRSDSVWIRSHLAKSRNETPVRDVTLPPTPPNSCQPGMPANSGLRNLQLEPLDAEQHRKKFQLIK